MKFIVSWLTFSPLIPTMSFKLYLSPVDVLLGGSGTPDVEPGHLMDALGGIEGPDPLINPLHLSPPVPVAWWRIPIVWEPNKFRRRKERGHSKGVRISRVVFNLPLYMESKPLDLHGDAVKVPTLGQVIQPSYKQHSQWSVDFLVIKPISQEQVRDCRSRDCQPVDMGTIWRTINPTIPRLVILVEGAGAHAHIQSIGHPGQVGGLASWAHVGSITGGIFSPLKSPNLPS